MIEIKDIYKKIAEQYNEDEEYIAFVMQDVFNAVKLIIKEKFFVNFWKGVSLSPWITIVISPKKLIKTNRFEEFLWYKTQKRKFYEKNNKKGYKEFDFEIERFKNLKEKLINWLDENNIEGEERDMYLLKSSELAKKNNK
jgi:hypothetical protein